MADQEGNGIDSLADPLAASPVEGRAALDRLFDTAYGELRRMAHQRLFRAAAITSLDTTALVHECYLRLAKLGGFRTEDRPYLMCYAARAMRSIIIDLLRQRGAARHGGDAVRVTLDPQHELATSAAEEHILRVNEALEELQSVDARLARVVEMKYFAGLEFDQIGQALGVSERTAQRDWKKARLWLDAALRD